MSSGSQRGSGVLFVVLYTIAIVAPLAMILVMHPASASDDATYGWLLPECVTETGDRIDNLFWMIFWIVGIVFLGTEGALLWFAIKYAAKPGQKAFYSHGSHKLELIWTIIPAIILAFIGIVQIPSWAENKVESEFPKEDPGALEVHVLAQQYAWRFRYPGPDGKFGSTNKADKDPAAKDDYVLETLQVPVDRPVILKMRSLDVLHALFIPNARFKQDLVPGLEIPGWFKIRKPGVYPIACAELCGEGHYTMGSTLYVYSAEEWEQKQAQYVAEFGGPNYSDLNETFRHWDLPMAEDR